MRWNRWRQASPGISGPCRRLRSALRCRRLLSGLDRTGKTAVLFLDDYEAVSDPAIHRDVNLLLSALPRQVTLAVASRVEPPFPLARLRACGGLLELQASDLRFTLTRRATT